MALSHWHGLSGRGRGFESRPLCQHSWSPS